MEKMINQVQAIIAEELERTQKKYGTQFHSTHEAYAVTLEERDEAIREVAEVDKALEEFWLGIIGNDSNAQETALLQIKNCALKAACEYIQVAAMVSQALDGYAIKPAMED